jgi:riboflavin synthase
MFTGIIESLGTIEKIEAEGQNIHFSLSCSFTQELKVDQSVAHNGVCLTVTKIEDSLYWVTAIQETLSRTNLKNWKTGDLINLERCMQLGDRLDGHIVQGHVDAVAKVHSIQDENGSWRISFQYPSSHSNLLVDKGSVTVNGVSLTVIEPGAEYFSVAIIPYTWEHTGFHSLKVGDWVNLEFDILGKFVQRMLSQSGRI